MNGRFEDEEITCCSCPSVFTFTASEQKYFASRKLSPPRSVRAGDQEKLAA